MQHDGSKFNIRAEMPDDFATLDATAQADLVRRSEVAPIELVDAAIERIERLNPALNAVTIPLFDKARKQALSPALPEGPFRGVPLLVKDYFCFTAGDPYYEGTRFLKDIDWHEPTDSYLAAKLRAAGFIFLGKTNLPELAAGVGTAEGGPFGRSNNPWDPARAPGGSSSGSAVAVACGLVGLKPSRGRVSSGPGENAVILGQYG